MNCLILDPFKRILEFCNSDRKSVLVMNMIKMYLESFIIDDRTFPFMNCLNVSIKMFQSFYHLILISKESFSMCIKESVAHTKCFLVTKYQKLSKLFAVEYVL